MPLSTFHSFIHEFVRACVLGSIKTSPFSLGCYSILNFQPGKVGVVVRIVFRVTPLEQTNEESMKMSPTTTSRRHQFSEWEYTTSWWTTTTTTRRRNSQYLTNTTEVQPEIISHSHDKFQISKRKKKIITSGTRPVSTRLPQYNRGCGGHFTTISVSHISIISSFPASQKMDWNMKGLRKFSKRRNTHDQNVNLMSNLLIW